MKTLAIAVLAIAAMLSAAPAAAQVRYWTVFASGSDDNLRTSNLNEAASAITDATTADPTGMALANTAYFRFTNYAGQAPTGAVTLTYCLGGTATGVTQAALIADANLEHDYVYPGNYDPTSTDPGYTSSAGLAGCVGRGTLTVPITATDGDYRLGITLNDDGLNEGDETITAVVVRAQEAGGGSLHDGGFNGATRTIKDNDAISVSIANAGTDAAPAPGFQARETRQARFTVTLDKPSAGPARVAFIIMGLEAADYVGGVVPALSIVIPAGQTSGEIRLSLADDMDGSLAETSEAFIVTLAETGHTAAGAIGRSSTLAEQSAIQIIIPGSSARTLVLTRTESDYATPATGGIAEGADAATTPVYFAGVMTT